MTGNHARYSGVAMLLHWAIAVAVIVNWRLAENFDHAEGADKLFWITQHKALGITILVLSVLRLLWRFTHRPPAQPAHYAPWERWLAKIVHGVFYILLIGLPIGGWLASSYSGYPIPIWGLGELPLFPVAKNEDLGHEIAELHGAGGEIMLILIGVHVLGMLKHMVIDRDGNLWRMLPFGTPKA